MSDEGFPRDAAQKNSSDDPDRKSAAKWLEVMTKGGLSRLTDSVLTQAEAFSDKDWKKEYEDAKSRTLNFDVVEHDHTSGRARRNAFFQSIHDRDRLTSAIVRHTDLDRRLEVFVEQDLRRFLLGSAHLLDDVFRRLPSLLTEEQIYERNKVDLQSPDKIMLDNIQTMLDVTSILASAAKTPRETAALTERLLQKCPNDEVEVDNRRFKINPLNYTYLELFALAPFSFWAEARKQAPYTCNSAQIVRLEDKERPIDPVFIYTITRERPRTHSDRHIRHGGCPALHPRLRELDLINRLGRLFVRAQKEFLKNEIP